MHLWLLRHGRSLADDEEKFEGRYDSPPTEIGRQQASNLANRWYEEGISFNRVICSTLKRACETAEIIGGRLGVEVEPDANWMEIDNGPMAGLPRDEAKERYPLPSFISPFYRIADVSESFWELHCRAAKALQSIINSGIEKQLVVSHGGILNAACRVICGTVPPVNSSGLFFAFQDNGFLQVAYEPERYRWSIKKFDIGFT